MRAERLCGATGVLWSPPSLRGQAQSSSELPPLQLWLTHTHRETWVTERFPSLRGLSCAARAAESRGKGEVEMLTLVDVEMLTLVDE